MITAINYIVINENTSCIYVFKGHATTYIYT